MPSLRFPFSFSQPTTNPNPLNSPSSSRPSSIAVAVAVAAAAATLGVGMGIATISKNNTSTTQSQRDPLLQNAMDFFLSHYKRFNISSPIWGSLSLADTCSAETVVDSKTGASFPTTIVGDTQKLLGIGLRKKSLLGLKKLDIYAFGVYADDSEIKNLLSQKYASFSVSELKGTKEFLKDVMDEDVCMTIRLQIVYGRLSIHSVRSAFEESVRNRLPKFGGGDDKELVQRFTSFFKDEFKLPRGSVIDLSKEHGYMLRTRIDGTEVGSIQSKPLCQAILDLYIGEDPFDAQAKEDVGLNLASLLQS